MDVTKFITVVQDLTSKSGAISLSEAFVELGLHIEKLDPSCADHDKNVAFLMRISASICNQLSHPATGGYAFRM